MDGRLGSLTAVLSRSATCGVADVDDVEVMTTSGSDGRRVSMAVDPTPLEVAARCSGDMDARGGLGATVSRLTLAGGNANTCNKTMFRHTSCVKRKLNRNINLHLQ